VSSRAVAAYEQVLRKANWASARHCGGHWAGTAVRAAQYVGDPGGLDMTQEVPPGHNRT